MTDQPPIDYTWVVSRSPNPNKAWIVDKRNWKKLSTLMSAASAERICIAHNMSLKYVRGETERAEQNKPKEINLCNACKRPDHFGDCAR